VWFVDARGCFAGATACAAVGVGVGAAWVVVLPVAAAVAVVVAAVLAAAPGRTQGPARCPSLALRPKCRPQPAPGLSGPCVKQHALTPWFLCHKTFGP
jgi:hypothetical protein